MNLINKLASNVGKKVAEKAVEKITSEYVSKTTNFLKQAGKEVSISDVKNTVGIATGTSGILETATFTIQTALDVGKTKSILNQKVEKLREEGKITQDILDAILCENKNKLEIACKEVFEAERIGKKLKYLSKEEVDDALSIRKAITKTVMHTVLG